MPEIVMPQLGESVTEGTITRWFKSVGDTVTEDEPLFEVSTDKVDTEVPSPASGVLTEIKVEEGDTVEVGTPLATVGEGGAAPGEEPAAEAPAEEAQAAEPEPAPEPEPVPEPPTAPAPEPAPETRAAPAPAPQPAPAAASAASGGGADGAEGAQGRLLSPLVRRLVEQNGLDVSRISGTGVGGRITREDVLDAIDSAARQTPAASPQPSAQQPSAQAAPAPAAPAPAPAAPTRPAAPAVAPMSPGAGDVVEPLNRIRQIGRAHV